MIRDYSMAKSAPAGFGAVVLALLLLAPVCLTAQAPTDQELQDLEHQIEQQETEQAQAKKRAAEEAQRKTEEARRQAEEDERRRAADEGARRQADEAARAQAEAEARRAEASRLQLERQKRETFDRHMAEADAAVNKGDFALAARSYALALEVFPDSAAAGAGFARAREFEAVCTAIVGEWDWVWGSTAVVNADGTVQGIALIPNSGTWECTDPAQRKFTLRWKLGGWVDTVTLSADGNTVDAVNNIGMGFQAHRKGSRKEPPAVPNPLFRR